MSAPQKNIYDQELTPCCYDPITGELFAYFLRCFGSGSGRGRHSIRKSLSVQDQDLGIWFKMDRLHHTEYILKHRY